MILRVAPTILLIALLFLSAGCSPSISPLFRDFEVGSGGQDAVQEALEAAGWSLDRESDRRYMTTLPRRFNNRGLMFSEVKLEVVPMAGEHVRVFFHAERVYFFGHRGDLPYLSSGLRDSIVPVLAEAFSERGMKLVTDTVDGR